MEMEFRYGSGGAEPMKIHRRRRDPKSTFIGQTCNYIVYSPIDFTSYPKRDAHRNSQFGKLFSQTDFGMERGWEEYSTFAGISNEFRLCENFPFVTKVNSLGKPIYSRGYLGSNVIHHRFVG